MTLLPRCLLLAITALLCDVPAQAAICTLSTSGVAFGSYDPLDSADKRSAGIVRLTCDEPVSATIALSHNSPASAARALTNGSDQLVYELYADPQRTSVWGDGSGGGSPVTLTGDGTDRSIYGVIPARQRVSAGTYVDTIMMTVSY